MKKLFSIISEAEPEVDEDILDGLRSDLMNREFYRRGFYSKFDESKINRDEGGKFSEQEAAALRAPAAPATADNYARRLQSASYARRLDKAFVDRGFYAKFDESKVKRDKDGKFATKSQGADLVDKIQQEGKEASEKARAEMEAVRAEQAAAEAATKLRRKRFAVQRGGNVTVNSLRNLEVLHQGLFESLNEVFDEEMLGELKRRGGFSQITNLSEMKGGWSKEDRDYAMWNTSPLLRQAEEVDEDILLAEHALEPLGRVGSRWTDATEKLRRAAKKKVNASLVDRLLSPGGSRLSATEGRTVPEDVKKSLEKRVRRWVDQWAHSSGKGAEAIALQLAAEEEFGLGGDTRFSRIEIPEFKISTTDSGLSESETRDTHELYQMMGGGSRWHTFHKALSALRHNNPVENDTGSIETTQDLDEVFDLLLTLKSTIPPDFAGNDNDYVAHLLSESAITSKLPHLAHPDEFIRRGLEEYGAFAELLMRQWPAHVNLLIDLKEVGDVSDTADHEERYEWLGRMSTLDTKPRGVQDLFPRLDPPRKSTPATVSVGGQETDPVGRIVETQSLKNNYKEILKQFFNSMMWIARDEKTHKRYKRHQSETLAAKNRNRQIDDAEETLEDNGGLMQSFIAAQHDETQELLAGWGYQPDDTITLYRGMAWDEKDTPESISTHPRREAGSDSSFIATENITQSAMSSYSMSFGEAAQFATRFSGTQAMVVAEVPVSSILSVPVTGVGCLSEGEVVVLKNDGNKTLDVNAAGHNVTADSWAEEYNAHLKEKWSGPTEQRINVGLGRDLVPGDPSHEWPLWY